MPPSRRRMGWSTHRWIGSERERLVAGEGLEDGELREGGERW